jgi:hypothetical protein
MFWAPGLLQLRTLFAAISWFVQDSERRRSRRPNAAVRYEDEHAIGESYPGAVGGT